MLAISALGQTDSNQRTFPQSRASVEKALKAMQGTLAGHLPVLDGFAKPSDHPFDRYSRGYYQTTVQVSATPTGGTVVHVVTKVTAWYADPASAHSGYQLLTSNGRIESDLLDQLAEQLSSESAPAAAPAADASTTAVARTPAPNAAPVASVPPASVPRSQPANPATSNAVDAPSPRFPSSESTSLSSGLAAEASTAEKSPDTKTNRALQSEVDSLEEVLKNQAHPKNLVAVKKSGTPVVATASLTAKTLFMASMHDEFEMIDFNRDWVHVRISGLSRGWIWRNSVEMPDGIADTDGAPAQGFASAADLFHVVREESALFPGDWEPLRDKNVKIISVQNVDDTSPAGAKQRLEFTKSLLEKNYNDLVQPSQKPLAGIVVIFDSADGGMIAATTSTLQQWKAGTLSDAALWHKCFFDPPEILDSSAPSGGQ